ncbi:MAG: IS1634 family transposase [Halobacteriovoraceae bacterium]|nr:IS1634 family transposase [Halobacteriovoraceae bacterium]
MMEFESKELAHYGLVKAVMDKTKLTERMGQILPKKERHHKLEHSEVITALLYNMLGHGSGRLYSAKNFYQKFPTEEIFGRKIEPKSFNASTLSRTLDAVSKYGPDEFFLDTAFKIAMDLKLLARELHLDSTSISFQGKHKKSRRGRKNKFDIKKPGEIDLTYGHSKAKRPDLIQMVMSMITGGSSGIPYWINTHSGNTQDKELFQDVIARMTSWMDTYAPLKTNYFVADSALYSKSYLLNHSHHTLWISRVPESVNKAKAILERGHKGKDWIKLKGGLKYRAFKTEHCGIPQRWFVVHSHKAYFKEKTNFENRLDEKEYELHRTVNKLKRQLFKEKDVALETAKKIRGAYPFHKVKTKVVPHYEGYIGSDQRYMALQGYAVEVEYQRNFEKIKRARNRKGKWIVATNIKEWEKTDLQIIEAYNRRNANIETCFRQIKSTQFLGKGIYFKSVKRIQAYMSIVALALFVNNIGQLILRKGLSSTKQNIKNFANKKIKNPTFAMVAKLLRRVQILKVKVNGRMYRKILDLDDDLVKVINIFGPSAQKIYGFP